MFRHPATYLAFAFAPCLTGSTARTAAPAEPAARTITVYPRQVRLDGPRDQQRLLVVGRYAEGQRDLSRSATFTSDTPEVATIDAHGIVRPAADGRAYITVQAGGRTATVRVRVRHAADDVPVSFSREIVPTLTRLGCNQGACHGGLHGRGGFRLSLLGYDPAFDYHEIVQSAEGRHVALADPAQSILLLKPTLTMEHGGGERFAVNSRPYLLLKRWLEDGAPEPSPKDPVVTALSVWPPRRVMTPGEQQQLGVRATWADGRTEDVTANAQFDALNDAVAAVTPDGLVTARGRGESHIMVRFGGQAAVMQVTLPYTSPLTPDPSPPKRGRGEKHTNFIDDKLAARWDELHLTPSRPCGDAEFFRRIHLDAIGTLPTPAEVRAFLADRRADKRGRAIDEVLRRPEFIDFWTLKWGDLLRINRTQLQDKGMWSFRNWVRSALRDSMPVDEFARQIITAEGSTYTQGPANYYSVARTPADRAETTTQLFLGVRLQCAKCHHHPFEMWSQDDYYGMAAFFARLGAKNSQDFGIFGRETVIFLRPAGEVVNPHTRKVARPHPLGGPVMDDPIDRRRKLAEWVTAPDNPYFARNIVNRFWGYFMGRGLVEPLDDLRATNPPSNPELLDALAADFVRHRYDLKYLMRTIMTSRGYQLSPVVAPGNAADKANTYFARYTVKRLTAEELADAIDFATGTREKYPGLPVGTRAIQLPDPAVRSPFLDVFGRPPRRQTCECERTSQPNIAQALNLLNGDALNRKIAAPTGRVERLLRARTPLPAAVRELYLATLSRPPGAAEAQTALAMLKAAPTPREGVQDLLWALLNSREFFFNH
jgi:hypothetical protein